MQCSPNDYVLVYHCGSTDGWSALFSFTAMKNGSDWSPRFAVFGDLGNENPQSIPRLQEEVQRGMYDSILHIGIVRKPKPVFVILFTIFSFEVILPMISIL